MSIFNLFNHLGKRIGTADAPTKAEAKDGATTYAGNGQHIDAELCRDGCVSAPSGGKNRKPLKHSKEA